MKTANLPLFCDNTDLLPSGILALEIPEKTHRLQLPETERKADGMRKKIVGVIPPIITPVDKQERVDETGLRTLVITASTTDFMASLCAAPTGNAWH